MVGDWLCQGDPSLSLCINFWISTSTFTCTTLANQRKSLVHHAHNTKPRSNENMEGFV